MKFPDTCHVVGDAIGGVLVGADVHSDNTRMRTPLGQAAKRRFMTFIVEAKPVDHRVVLNKAENPRLRIARLGQRRERAYFGEAEAEVQQRIGHFGIFVIARGHAERIRKA